MGFVDYFTIAGISVMIVLHLFVAGKLCRKPKRQKSVPNKPVYAVDTEIINIDRAAPKGGVIHLTDSHESRTVRDEW